MTSTRPAVILTVDVEDFFEPRPPFDTYHGIIGTEKWATPLIMDVLEDLGGRGTFFVDVYNRRTVSEETISSCVKEIDERGHEVGLHTHPLFPEGKRGYGMAQTMKAHTLDEQTEFIEKGVELLERWIGKRPTSHRAGGYGANYDTLVALERNGVPIDSSAFFGYPHCGLNDPPLAVNDPVQFGGVTQFPVTVTRCEMKAGPLKLFSMIKKLDPDWSSAGELKRQIDAVVESGSGPVILFLHSYSLIDIENGFRPNPKAVSVLKDVLSHAADAHNARLTSIESVVDEFDVTESDQLRDPPVVKSDLVFRNLELTWWLLKKVRPRHVRGALGLR
ncbi:MAG: polysaccharide deacetylase family protein [Pseudomonadota bacterium]